MSSKVEQSQVYQKSERKKDQSYVLPSEIDDSSHRSQTYAASVPHFPTHPAVVQLGGPHRLNISWPCVHRGEAHRYLDDLAKNAEQINPDTMHMVKGSPITAELPTPTSPEPPPLPVPVTAVCPQIYSSSSTRRCVSGTSAPAGLHLPRFPTHFHSWC
jgi:hypothetical protein